MSQNQEVTMNQKQPVPVKICAPDVKNHIPRQNRTVTGSDVWTAASGFMSCALRVAIVAIPVVSSLFEKKTRKLSEATHHPIEGHLTTLVGTWPKEAKSSHMMLLLLFSPYSQLYSLLTLYIRK